jgi:type I restriction enzyme R subunit
MAMEGRLLPEQEARVGIDAMLEAAGWVVQDYRAMNLRAADGVAVGEFPTARGPTDYMLFVKRRAIGSVEAKKKGLTLRGVEPQGDKYAHGFKQTAAEKGLKTWRELLPFHYMSTGAETLFASRIDPTTKPREVFAFHRPETLLAWAQDDLSMRARLRTMPPLDPAGLRDAQVKAVTGLEESFRADRQRSLVSMTMGAGKTYVAVSEAYRLIRHAGAKRILFLVDRINLGVQAGDEFRAYVTPDDGRKLSELYDVQLLRSNYIDPAAKVVITTIQRLYSILRGDEEFDETLEAESSFETQRGSEHEPRKEVVYQPKVPIETFDFIFTDECHRSIYGKWGEVLDYFDAFLVGLTATPSKFTYGYFKGNVILDYTHEQSVIDGVNVDYNVYRIDTAVTRAGSTIERGEWVQIRDTVTREEAFTELDDDITYDQAKLDRAVVAPDQIRTVVRTFRDKVCTEIFPGRTEVPKTIVFCKSDSHAEDVLEAFRDEFGRGSEFAKKVTYRAEQSSQELIRQFRNDPVFRIAVSVDQIATGTDIKPVECLLFMRMVASRSLFEQMKGRGVRCINPDELQAVTPDARVKDHFVIIDAVGITDEGRAWADSRPLDREPSVPLKNLLQRVAEDADNDELLTTLGSRLLRLDRRLNDEQREEIADLLPAGTTLVDLAADLINATELLHQTAAASAELGEGREPTDDEIDAARERLVDAALAPLADPKVRQKILDIQTQTQQLIDLATQDQVFFTGFTDFGQAEDAVETFEQFLQEHRDEYVAIAAYYHQPVRRRLSLKDIKRLAHAIETPPLNLTPEKLWKAYEKLDGSKVRGEGGRVLTDIVSLVRYALKAEDALVPHIDAVRVRFDLWVTEQESAGRNFSAEQRRWLEMVRDHIATSMTIEPDDFDLDPFAQEGGLDAAYDAFGDQLNPLLDELNMVLADA